MSNNYLNARGLALEPSETLAVKARAQALRAEGRNIVDLSAGEPEVDTPEHIKAAAVKALAEGRTKYLPVPGLPELREALAKKVTLDNGIAASRDDVVVTNGGKQALYAFFQVTLEPGDEVIIPAPYWVSYPAMVRLAGGVPVIVPTKAEHGYKLGLEALERAITPRTRVVIFNSPSNPTGAMYSADEFRAIGALLEQPRYRRILIVSDEVYEKVVLGQVPFISFAKVAADLADRTYTVFAFSKTYAMTGWRVGYGVGPRPLIDAIGKHQSQTTSNVCSIAQYAALAAVQGPHDFLASMVKSYRSRAQSACEVINRSGGALQPVRVPEGAFYLFIGFNQKALASRGISTSADLTQYLLDKAGVAVVPGGAFGDDQAFRISLAIGDQTLAEGLQRIVGALQE